MAPTSVGPVWPVSPRMAIKGEPKTARIGTPLHRGAVVFPSVGPVWPVPPRKAIKGEPKTAQIGTPVHRGAVVFLSVGPVWPVSPRMAVKGEPKTAQIGAPVQGVGKVGGISGFVLRGVDARCGFGDLSYLYPVMVEEHRT